MEPILRVLRDDQAWGPNLLRNAGFEEAGEARAAGWQPYEAGYLIAAGQGRGGGSAAACEAASVGRFGAFQTVELRQQQPVPIRVRGWSRALDVSGRKTSDYSAYVDLMHEDGTPLWAQTADFATGTHDWEQAVLRLEPKAPIRVLRVYLMFRKHSGRVWFDDVSLKAE